MNEVQAKHFKRTFKAHGIPLPKVPLRPFIALAHRMDDREYVETSMGDKKYLLFLPVILIYVWGGGLLIAWTAIDETWALFTGLSSIVFALWAHLKLRRTKPKQFVIYDREKGVNILPASIFRQSPLEIPFVECEGRISRNVRSAGAPCHMLWMVHPQYGPMLLEESVGSVDFLLGYWSFLAQYMDKTKPLPDVAWLQDYPNRTKGWGSREEWEALSEEPGFIDPYEQWKAIVSQNPQLDSNYYMEHPEELAKWNGKPPWSLSDAELVEAGIIPPTLLPPDEQQRHPVPKLRFKDHPGKKALRNRQQKLKEEEARIKSQNWAVVEKRGDFEDD